jgi:hypothetical protein
LFFAESWCALKMNKANAEYRHSHEVPKRARRAETITS